MVKQPVFLAVSADVPRLSSDLNPVCKAGPVQSNPRPWVDVLMAFPLVAEVLYASPATHHRLQGAF